MRYWYNDDGQSLPQGTVEVVQIAGQVRDLVGNVSPQRNDTFRFDSLPPRARIIVPAPQSIFQDDLGYLEIQWEDGPAGLDGNTLGTTDLVIQGVSIDSFEVLDNGNVRYWYNEDEEHLRLGSLLITFAENAVSDRAGNQAILGTESVLRLHVACAWNNLLDRFDTNYDGFVTPHDVLVTINQLNGRSLLDATGRLVEIPSGQIPPPFYDVNCDNFATPNDVLIVINELNRRALGAEGEWPEESPRLRFAAVNPTVGDSPTNPDIVDFVDLDPEFALPFTVASDRSPPDVNRAIPATGEDLDQALSASAVSPAGHDSTLTQVASDLHSSIAGDPQDLQEVLAELASTAAHLLDADAAHDCVFRDWD